MKTSIGLCGATGKTPELQIGQVKTVDYTQKASVEITGTRENPILNFNIPKGKDGAKLIVREYFNGDIQILNNLNELPQDTNSDSYGKTVMSVNGIKQLLEKINDVLTKANANTNAIGSLTSTVQGNKSDIETKLNNFKSDTDTKVQSINQTISELEQTIETKLNEELTKQVKALQDENKKLNDMIFENSLKENFEGSDPSISDTSNGVAVIETIKGQTIVTDAPTEENPNYKLIESVGDKENNKISILTHGKNLLPPLKNYSTTIGYPLKGILKNGVKYKAINLAGQLIKVSESKDSDTFLAQSTNGIIEFTYDGSGNLFVWKQYPDNIELYYNENVDNIMIMEQGLSDEFVPYKQDKKEILVSLDGGLKSLPNGVCDTIEQKEDGVYLVQRIGKVVLNGSENWDNFRIEESGLSRARFGIDDLKAYSDMITSRLTRVLFTNNPWTLNYECISIEDENLDYKYGHKLMIYLKNVATLDDFKANLQANPVTVYYELENTIETKLDINNLNLKTFKDLTYITSENSIKPVLKGQATKDINKVLQNLQQVQQVQQVQQTEVNE